MIKMKERNKLIMIKKIIKMIKIRNIENIERRKQINLLMKVVKWIYKQVKQCFNHNIHQSYRLMKTLLRKEIKRIMLFQFKHLLLRIKILTIKQEMMLFKIQIVNFIYL